MLLVSKLKNSMIEKTKAFLEYLQTGINQVIKHIDGNKICVLKAVKEEDLTNLQILSSLIQSRRSHDRTFKNKMKEDDGFEIGIEKVNKMNVLTVRSPFFNGKNINYKSGYQQTITHIIIGLINELIKGDNNYFYSHNNIQWDEKTRELYTNITSNVGLLYLLKQQPIHKKKFIEIFELLNPKMFEEKDMKLKMNYKLKFKAIAIFIISLALKFKLSLIQQDEHLEEYVTIEEGEKKVALLQKRFAAILSNKQLKKRIEALENEDRVNYAVFLKRVLLEQCDGLTWSEVIELLIFKYKRVKPHTNVFIDFANQLFDIEPPQAQQYFREMGLGEPGERQLYLAVKLGVNIGFILRFDSFEEYIRTENNWDEDKERICNMILMMLNKLEEHYNKKSEIESKFTEPLEGSQKMEKKEMKIQSTKESTFDRFSQIYTIVQASMGYYRTKINQVEIKYLSNQKKILSKYFDL